MDILKNLSTGQYFKTDSVIKNILKALNLNIHNIQTNIEDNYNINVVLRIMLKKNEI